MNAALPKHILVVRTDRIGDVVLSLPMITAVRSCFPHSSISVLVRSYTKDLVAGHPDVQEVLAYDAGGAQKPFRRMLSELKARRFDTVVVTYPTLRLAMLVFLAGIPVRVGTGYRWYSALFSHRVYEHRKTAEKHEAEYNLSLLSAVGCTARERPVPRLTIDHASENAALAALAGVGIRPGSPFVVLHPGSGGSARDWRPERFGGLAKALGEQGMEVIVTGGPGEEALVEHVVEISGGKARKLQTPLALLALASLIRRAEVFVSNSTGPLHIAAAVGTATVAFFPPIRQCSSVRWGPLTDKRVIFEPSADDCPRCSGGPCRGQECMDLISVEDVVGAVQSLSRRDSGKRLAPVRL